MKALSQALPALLPQGGLQVPLCIVTLPSNHHGHDNETGQYCKCLEVPWHALIAMDIIDIAITLGGVNACAAQIYPFYEVSGAHRSRLSKGIADLGASACNLTVPQGDNFSLTMRLGYLHRGECKAKGLTY